MKRLVELGLKLKRQFSEVTIGTPWIYDPYGQPVFYQVSNYIYDPTGACKYWQLNYGWYAMNGGQAAYYVQNDWIYAILGQPKFQYRQISATLVWN